MNQEIDGLAYEDAQQNATHGQIKALNDREKRLT